MGITLTVRFSVKGYGSLKLSAI